MDFENKNIISWELKNFCRWVNHKAVFKSVAWNEYKNYRKIRKYKDKESLELGL